MAQPSCLTSVGAVYGTPNVNERAKSILPTAAGDGIYAVGMIEDSVLIVRLNLEGERLWSRSFDIVPNETDNVTTSILDSEGMIVTVGIAGDYGIGGSVFAFRYNPLSNQILWANEYIHTWSGGLRNYAFAICQKPNGNYVFVANPHPVLPATTNDDELFEISKTTGNPVAGMDKVYHFGGSDATSELIYYQNHFYGVGRYTDGVPNDRMRNTLVKFDANTFAQVWVKMGHVTPAASSRLYGKDIVLYQDMLYSIYFGDPVSNSTTNTKLYAQKTDLSGNVSWIKQYELPGNNDVGHQMIETGGNFLILAAKNAAPTQAIILKIDSGGNLIWAKQLAFAPFITSVAIDRGNNQLLEIGGDIWITVTGNNSNGSTDMIVVKLDEDGNVDMPCASASSISLSPTTISSTTFYSISPTQFNGTEQAFDMFPELIETPLPYREECVISDTLFEIVNAAICQGESYEGYTIAGTYEDIFTTVEGCDSVRTLNLSVNPPESTSENITICLGASYNGYAASGVYSNTFQNSQGCDSIHTLFLNVDPLEVELAVQICEGQSYEGYTTEGFYIDTLQGPPNDCDTVRHLTLSVTPAEETFFAETICEGESYEGYTSTGFYTDVFQNAFGCDSIRNLDLTVEESDEVEENVTICEGLSYNGYTQTGSYSNTFQNVFGCDSTYTLNLEVVPFEFDVITSICDGESYEGYTETGFYTDVLPGTAGECDTTRYLELTVHPHEETFIELSICDGDEYEGYTSTGVYTDQFVSVHGCDSIRHLDLVVTEEITTFYSVIICPGDSYEGYSNPGIYEDEFTSAFGCDSIRTLELEFGSPETFQQVTICANEDYLGYTAGGQYIDTLYGTFGDCDTILYLDLEVLPLEAIAIDQTICSGDSYLGYSLPGFYIDTLQSNSGCDSIRSLALTVVDELTSNQFITICQGETFEGYFQAGTYTDTFTSVFGCDSIRLLDLQVSLLIHDVSVSLCSGGEYEGHTEAGIYLDTIDAPAGICDTLRQLTISITPPLLTFINAGICAGQTFLGYNATGLYTDTFQTITGCDSVRMLNLTVDDEIIMDELISICLGQSYQGYSEEGFYTDTFTSVFGCDSIRHLELSIDAPVSSESVVMCEGDTYLGYTQTGTYSDTLSGVAGECDTFYTLFLTVTPAIESEIIRSICEGQSFEGYNATGVYVDTFQTAEGCDSIRTLHLTVDDIILAVFDIQICNGDNHEGYTLPGIYADTFPTLFGCDSIRQLNLGVLNPEKTISVDICTGQKFEQYDQSGVYQDILPGIGTDCDTTRKIFLTVFPAPVSFIEQAICDGEAYEGYSQPGNYVDTLITNEGCDSIRTLSLTVEEPVRNSITASICDQLLTEYSQPGVYIDTLVSVRGCDSIQEFVIKEASLFIPNVFSPNDDGINDEFIVIPYPATELTIDYFAIFDRFGNMVYETEEWPILWKGTDHEGEKFQPAVFAYVLIYQCTRKVRVQHGNITLLK